MNWVLRRNVLGFAGTEVVSLLPGLPSLACGYSCIEVMVAHVPIHVTISACAQSLVHNITLRMNSPGEQIANLHKRMYTASSALMCMTTCGQRS